MKAARALLRLGEGWGEGVVDWTQSRYAIDYGAYAVVYEDGRQWGGRPGRPRRHSEPEARPIPVWLVDLMAGTVSATSDDSAGRLDVVVDVARAAEQVAGLDLPSADSVADLHAVPAEVSLEGGMVRRIVIAVDSQRYTLELADHGLTLDDFDWSRLPNREPEG